MSKSKIKFNCVDMKHRIQEEIYEETKNLSWEEKRRKFQTDIENSSLAEFWNSLHEKKKSRRAA